jgi:prepilin peptidase CpaA
MTELSALAELFSLLLLDPRTGALLPLLVLAAAIDWKTLRIPNWLTVGGMVVGLVVNAHAAPSTWTGIATAAMGLAVGLLLLLPMWMLRILGAGDVKLMAMVGAFIGPWPALNAVLYVVVAGGIAAVLFAASRGVLGRLAMNLRYMVALLFTPAAGAWRPGTSAEMPSVGRLPYGISICIGSTVYLVVRQLGLA